MKLLPYYLLFLNAHCLFGQGIFHIRPEDNNLYMRNVAHLTAESGIGVTNKLPILSCVLSDSSQTKHSSALLSFDTKGKVIQSVALHSSNASVAAVKHLPLGGDNYALYGTSISTNLSFSRDFLYKVNLRTGASSSVKMASNADLALATTAIDMVSQGRKIFLMGQAVTPGSSIPKVVLRSIDTSLFSTSPVTLLYPAVSTSRLLASTIESLPNGNLLIGGTVQSGAESIRRPILFEVDGATSKVIRAKEISLWNPDQTKEYSCNSMIVRKNAGRYFGFTQTFDSLTGYGQLYSIMLDSMLNVLTWRNYELPFNMERAAIDGGYFWVSGATQAAKGFPGYAMLKINASNAIIEKIYYYSNFLKNDNLNTSTVAVLDKTTREPVFLATPGGDREGAVAMVWRNDAMGQPMCDSTFAYTVFKSPLFSKDYAMVSEQLPNPTFYENDLELDQLNFATEEKCVRVSSIDQTVDGRCRIIPNPNMGTFHVRSDKLIDEIRVYDVFGNVVYERSYVDDEVVDISPLISGLYIAEFLYRSNVLERAKFQVLK